MSEDQDNPTKFNNKADGKTNPKDLVRVERQEFFSGPLPHPQVLAGYEQICPGAADRIISMAEKQSDHRQGLEKKVTASNIDNEKMGMYFAFLALLAFLIVGTVLLMCDKELAGLITLIATGGVFIGNYILTKKKEKEISEKKKKKIKTEEEEN